MTELERRVGIGIAVYFLVTAIAALTTVVLIFPEVNKGGDLVFPYLFIGAPDRQLALLALCAGIVGSFIHGAQSISSYLGNQQFKLSWTMWYLLRPWIGGVLGLAMYFAFRAGLVAGASFVNPYGVVAVALLAGWFSKTTGDKLQEVFETLFKTDADKKRADKLNPPAKPVITSISPSPLPAGQNQVTITGTGFQNSATLLAGNQALATQFVTDKQLQITFTAASRPAAATYQVQVKNPQGANDTSDAVSWTVQ